MKTVLSIALVLISGVSFAAPKSASETATLDFNGHSLKINYSAPSVKNRAGHIFDSKGLISHDPNYPVWRAGANAATVFHTDVDLVVGSLSVPKGDYTLFVDIRDSNKWILIINKETGQWGLKYNAAKDLGRVPMQMSKPSSTIETLKYDLKGSDGAGSLQLGWEDHVGEVAFKVK